VPDTLGQTLFAGEPTVAEYVLKKYDEMAG
jgi:hypothetical protein